MRIMQAQMTSTLPWGIQWMDEEFTNFGIDDMVKYCIQCIDGRIIKDSGEICADHCTKLTKLFDSNNVKYHLTTNQHYNTSTIYDHTRYIQPYKNI